MQLTLFSICMAVIWSSVLAAFNYFCRKKHFFIRHLGMANLLFLYLFPLVRMMAPFEFPFARVIPLKGTLGSLCGDTSPKTAGMPLSPWTILGALWAGVAAVLLLRFLCQYIKSMKEFSTYPLCGDAQCQRILQQVIGEGKKRMRVQARRSSHVYVPRGAGIFQKTILLPDGVYSDAELYYILRHECTHFRNKDLPIKLLVHLYSCVFWWNPVIYLIKRDLAQILEIKCDLDVTERMENREKAEYLATIVASLKKAEAKKPQKAFYGTAALAARTYDSEILERFLIVSSGLGARRKSLAFTGAWLLVFTLLIFASYSFVLQPDYHPLAEEGASVPEAPYTVKCIDGTYYVSFPR